MGLEGGRGGGGGALLHLGARRELGWEDHAEVEGLGLLRLRGRAPSQ